MGLHRRSRRILCAIVMTTALASVAWPAITPSGDVMPGNPATWTSSTSAIIGDTTAGALTVDGGSNLISKTFVVGYFSGANGIVTITGSGSSWMIGGDGSQLGFLGSGTVNVLNGATVSSGLIYLGYQLGSSGTMVVDGPGSQWNSASQFILGYSGNAVLNITNGSLVTVGSTLTAASGSSATALINFGPSGGALTSQSLFASPSQITGTGTINTNGLVTDGLVAFSAPSQSWSWNSASQNVMVNLNLTSGTGTFGVGYQGAGTMTIQPGTTITTALGYLGYKAGATGLARVSGSGAAWSNMGSLYLGYSGAGSLSISNGGAVGGVSTAYLGYNAGATGTLIVDGTASNFNCSSLLVGYFGSGTLALSNGASVSVQGTTRVGQVSPSVGLINFVSGGGTLTTQSLYAAPPQVTGNGVINARGLVSDLALTFDATHGLTQTLLWSGSGQSLTLNLDLSGAAGPVGDLGAGYQGVGTLVIQQGASVASLNGEIGYKAGSSGSATVFGPGSEWTTNALQVGISGSGSLHVASGGLVQSTSTYVGAASSSTATLTVSASSGLATSGTTYVGYFGTGTLNIISGGTCNSAACYIGDYGGATGTVTVSGAGSSWTITNSLFVGDAGTGALNITDGGKVNCLSSGQNYYLGATSYSTGAVSVDGIGSSWTVNGSLLVGAGQLPAYPHAPNSGMGMVTVTHGGKVLASTTDIGYGTNSVGMITVDGSGSSWASSATITVGFTGNGSLTVTNGGSVSDTNAYIGYNTGSTGAVIVDGPNSVWTNAGQLNVTTGSLNIADGGVVTAHLPVFGSATLLSVGVGDGSLLNLGTSQMDSAGVVRFRVVPGATPGIYTPIIAGNWDLATAPQTLGGMWNNATHKVTVSSPTTGNSGTPVGINLASIQRIIITDPASSQSTALAFQGTTTTSNIFMTAATLSDAQSTLLSDILPSNTPILGGWTFTASGYTAGNPVLLSVQVGPGHSLNNLDIWHFDGSAWSPFTPTDLSYDGTYANFTVTGFSGYAVTAAPEPATCTTLCLALLALRRPRRNPRRANGILLHAPR